MEGGVMLDRSRCIVIVPMYQHVEHACESSLRTLERQGFRVWRRYAGAAIDLGRNRLAAQALHEGYDELMWIDSDISFPADAVQDLRDRDVPIVGGMYPKKGEGCFSFHREDAVELDMGEDGGIVEVTYLPTGFMHTRREVYETMIDKLKLPLCNRLFGDTPFYPFFLPQVVSLRGESWYLPEDYAFSHRARECGYKNLMDTTIRLRHHGTYGYSWEDGCGDRPRYGKFHISINAPFSEAPSSDEDDQ
jgi:hypothetical protein